MISGRELDFVAAIRMCLPSSSVTMLHQDSPDQYSAGQNLETLQGTNTLGSIRRKKLSLNRQVCAADNPGGKGTRMPGTFMVAVYGPK